MACRRTCILSILVVTAAFGVMAAPSARAAFVAPNSWTRGASGATYQHWEVFDTYPTDNTPDVGNTNPNGTAALTETTGEAFITGGGNIYSFAATTAFEVVIPEADVPAPPHDATVIVQIKTLGTELDYDSVQINGTSPVDRVELFRHALGGFGGADVETWFLFNVPYAVFGTGTAGVVDLALTFAAADSSMSLDQIAIDTAIRPFGYYDEQPPIPEPATLALLSGAALVLLRRSGHR